MEPTYDLGQVLDKELKRMIRIQMLKFMKQDMAQVVVATLQEKAGQDQGGLVKLPTKGPVGVVADEHGE